MFLKKQKPPKKPTNKKNSKTYYVIIMFHVSASFGYVFTLLEIHHLQDTCFEQLVGHAQVPSNLSYRMIHSSWHKTVPTFWACCAQCKK